MFQVEAFAVNCCASCVDEGPRTLLDRLVRRSTLGPPCDAGVGLPWSEGRGQARHLPVRKKTTLCLGAR